MLNVRSLALRAFVVVSGLVAPLMGRTQATAAPAAPATDSTPAPRRRNTGWLTDRREFGVGDIIKVAIDEYALAEANKGTISEATRQRIMGVGGDASIASSGTSFGPLKGSLESSDKGASSSRGEATRGTRYVAEIAVRVTAVTPEGLLQVKGTKIVDVDKAKQEMTLSGLVRPQDVDARDVVVSAAVADARIVYSSKGLDKPKSGIVGRIVGIIWP